MKKKRYRCHVKEGCRTMKGFSVSMMLLAGSIFGSAQPASPGYRVLPPVKLYPGVAPGSESWKNPEKVIQRETGRALQNVTTPDYVAYLPDESRNTGTGVIVAPGGGFVHLSYDSEGTEVAKWLAERGVAAFLLKYRVMQTNPAETPMAAFAKILQTSGGPDGSAPNMDESAKWGIADGILAVKTIRAHATEYRIQPDKIVMLGFSAGAMVTAATMLQRDAAARPNYAAPIYGGPFGTIPEIPKDLPPTFMAVAQDDRLAGPAVEAFYQALLKAGARPEMHRFQSGGHGFGMNKQGKDSDHWIDEFFWWLEANDLTRKPGDPPRSVRAPSPAPAPAK